MDPKQDQAFKRLLKKLSALRVTLKNPERSLLDELVTGSVADVEAHVHRFGAQPKPQADADEVAAHSLTTRPTPRPTARPTAAADEVAAHSLTTRPTPRPTARPTAAADEVAAHSLTTRPTPRPTAKPAAAADEVAAHSLTTRPTPRPTAKPAAAADEVMVHSMEDDRAQLRPHPRVAFDPDKEEYRSLP